MLGPPVMTDSIFESGKLKQVIYKIQNISSEAYLDIKIYPRVVLSQLFT